MTEATQTRRSLEELSKTREWADLTPKQRNFLTAYITSGLETGCYSSLEAAQQSYSVSIKNAKSLSCQLLGNRKIKRLLNLHFGVTEQEALLADLSTAVAKSIKHDLRRGHLTNATVRGAQLIGLRVTGRDSSAPEIEFEDEPEQPASAESSAPTFKIGQRVQQPDANGVVRFGVVKIEEVRGE